MKQTHLLPTPSSPIHLQTCCASFPLFFSMCMIAFEQTFSSPVFHLSDYRYAIVGNKSILVPRLDGFEVGNSFNIALPRHKYQRHLICPSVTRAFLRVWLPRTETWGSLPSAPNHRTPTSDVHNMSLPRKSLARSALTLALFKPCFRPAHRLPRDCLPHIARTPPIPSTGSGLEVANRASSLFFLLREITVVIDAWLRFHRRSFGFHFRNTVVFGNGEAVVVFTFGLVISQCLPCYCCVLRAHGAPSHSLVVSFSSSSLLLCIVIRMGSVGLDRDRFVPSLIYNSILLAGYWALYFLHDVCVAFCWS